MWLKILSIVLLVIILFILCLEQIYEKEDHKKKDVIKPTNLTITDDEKTFYEAIEFCNKQNKHLASKDDLINAFDNGLDSCYTGWIDSGLPAFVVQTDRCMGEQGINYPPIKKNNKSGVWCSD